MKAVVISQFGAPEVLKWSEAPTPEAGPGDLLVRVRATAVNRADCLQRMGRYPAPADVPAMIPGLEYAGIVESVGRDVSDFKVGERVFGLVGGGAYAEYVAVHHRTVSRIPADLSFEEAAAIPEAFITAYDAIVEQGALKAGDWLLIHAVASGIGTAAIQIADAIGARCIGTTRSENKLERLKSIGLIHHVIPKDGKFAENVREVAGEVQVILEMVGGDYLAEDLKCLARKGRIVIIGLLGGPTVEFNLAYLLSKNATVKGTTMRSRPLEEKIVAGRLLGHNLAPLFESKQLKPIVDCTFDISDAAQAHTIMESNTSLGKIILVVPS
ncbi:MAG: NAD(P)H-quinone oxidoreductase [Cyanobacteria bacterium]|nr:NAD(P)H-quinone oxidoreductase [Cyanobacteriota bacterium]